MYPSLGIRLLHIKLTREGRFSVPNAKDIPASIPSPQPPEQPKPVNLEMIHDEKLRELLIRLGKTLNKNNRP
jgi:hypothetical protein